MNILPKYAVWLAKVGLCVVPICVSCYIAEAMALRRRMATAGRAWAMAGNICLAVIGACVLAAVVIWAMG